MTLLLIALIAIFVVAFTLDLLSTIVQAWKSATQTSVVAMEEIKLDSTEVIGTTKETIKFATLDWIQPVEELEEIEQIDVVAIAKARTPRIHPKTESQVKLEFTLKEQLQVMTVKRLRQLASTKKVKNYGSLNKNSLIAALVG